MKRKGKNRVILVSIMILLLGALLQSCEKPNTPDKPEELKPTLEVTTSPDGVLPYGKEFTLSAYDLYDNNRKCHVVFAVATAIDPSRLEKVEGEGGEYSDL